MLTNATQPRSESGVSALGSKRRIVTGSIPLPLAALVLYWPIFVWIANARSLLADFLASTDGGTRLNYSIVPRDVT